MSRADAGRSLAVRGMVFTAIAFWLCADLFDWQWMRDLAIVFAAMGAVGYFVLARRGSDE